ncbi:MATE family efflux transporter [Rhodococcus antarcticus]|uniref:MATE family efflux transporter n=1 Tax=Rhodococcus antarcticus TaxID=2987751 RepID=A0ABY6P4D3_9NOCA|nr:MATE family efflux transporter [Rhodococcus antarcticus]UZJ26525.1 MATE family efflux transporter [Rhodococcus antarcticus]
MADVAAPEDLDQVGGRRILGLALPALPVLAAEPLYLLVDTAVVGRLGAVALGALAVGAVVLAQVSTQLTFLSYGTTARAARLHGAGRRTDAVAEGVQASWLAGGVGIVLLALVQLVAGPVTRLLAGGGELAAQAEGWLRIASLGIPLVLVTLAGNGWMRGVQDTVRPLRYVLIGNGVSAVVCPVLVLGVGWGLPGSAVANVLAQVLSAGLFLRALAVERRAGAVSLRPDPRTIGAHLVLGRDLVLRSLAFQACFLSAAAVAARSGTAVVAAHQVVLQLWTFTSLVLDSLAVAAQALVGAALGAGRTAGARALAWRVTRWSAVFAAVIAAGFAAAHSVLPRVFTPDPAVLAQVPDAWWFLVAVVPVAGVVFALDGVLLGAGDAAFLRTATLGCAVLGFLPLIWLSELAGWGLRGIWAGLTAFVVLRMATVVARVRSDRWVVAGPVRT